MLDSWTSGRVFKHAFIGVAFSLTTALLTTISLFHLSAVRTRPSPSFQAEVIETYKRRAQL
jgi:hypothetical protein